jgi:hypothetical protein
VTEKIETWISWISLALVVPPVLVFILTDLLFWYFGRPGDILSKDIHAAAAGADSVARLYIMASILAVGGASYLALLLFANDMAKEFGRAMRYKFFATLAVGILVGIVWLEYGVSIDQADGLGQGFMKSAIHRIGCPGEQTCLPSDLEARFAHFKVILLLCRVALMLGAAVIIVGGVSCLVRPTVSLGWKAERTFIDRQRRRLRAYVDTASALMVVALLFGFAWMRWPLIVLDGPAAQNYAAHINAMSVFSGVSLSLVIASFAIPVNMALMERAGTIPRVEGAAGGGAPLLGEGFLGSAGKLLVVLAPSLAGAVPALVDFLGHFSK